MSNRAERRRQARISARAARHGQGCPDCGFEGPGLSDAEMAAFMKAQLGPGSWLVIRPDDAERLNREEYDAIEGLPEAIDYLIERHIPFRIEEGDGMWVPADEYEQFFGN